MTVKFENPPISEVAIGLYFDPPINEIRTEHIGLFWKQIRTKFPAIQQQHPISVSNRSSAVASPHEVFPMPRYWFISNNKANLIQIQKEAFFLNWRKIDNNYSGFSSNLLNNFFTYLEKYQKFLNQELKIQSPTVNDCELTYIDVIPKCEYWKHSKDISKVVPAMSVPEFDSVHTDDLSFNCSYTYLISDDTRLQLTFRTVTIPDHQLVIEFKTSGRPKDSEQHSIRQWYVQAHDIILNCFLKNTDSHIQENYWKRVK